MAKSEEKKEVKKKKTSPKEKQFLIKDLFKKSSLEDDLITEILMCNGIFQPIDEVDIKLTKAEFEEVITNYNNKRL